MKKLLIILLLPLLLVFIGCSETTKLVQLYIYDMGDPFMEDYADYIEEYSYGLYTLEIYDCQDSQVIQNELIEEGLETNPDLIIVNPIDRLSAYSIVNKVKQKDIPIIFINREPLESDLQLYDKAYYVGAIASQSGEYQADIIDWLFGRNPENLNHYDLNEDNIIQTVIFKGEQGHQDAEQRTQFVQSRLIDLGYSIEVLTIQTADWNYDDAYQLAIPTFELYGDQIEVVISNNDWMALGVLEAMIELGYIVDVNEDGIIQSDVEPWIPIIGIDGIEETKPMLENGFMHATVINDSDTQAIAAVRLAYALINDIEFDNPVFEITDNRYIWVNYIIEY